MNELLKVCGIDEAGRGAVIGPMVVAGILIDQSKVDELIKIKVKDSKKLSPGVRTELSKLIRELADSVKLVVLEASAIDSSTRKRGACGLNDLEAKIFAEIIDELKPDAAYIDLPSTKYDEFRSLIEERTSHRCLLILEHKADEKYPIVSAASIIAKCERDKLIEELKAKVGDFGSGYPSDEKTRKFLLKLIKNGKIGGRYVRSSWKTIAKVAQRKLDEFSEE